MDLEAALKDTPYKSRLDIIKKHSETVWKKDTVHHKHYTFHGMDHYSAVISVLNKLVDGIDPDSELTVHEIIRDYCLSDVKKKRALRDYHKSAAEYYLSKDANPESLLEASYQYIGADKHEKSAEIVINNANDFIDKGFWNRIEVPLKDAIKTFGKHRDDRNALRWVGLAHLRIGIFYLKRGDLALALEHAKESNKAFVGIRGKEKFDLYTLFGGIYGEMHKIDESRGYFGESPDFAEKNNDDYKKAVAYANIGTVYFSEGDKTKALELYLNSLKFFEEHNHTINAATGCNNIANAYSDLDDHNKAYDFIKKVMKLYKETEATCHIADVYVNYAAIYLNDPANKENLDPVLKCLSRSLKIYEKIGYLRGEASTYSKIGDYYRKQNDYISAIDTYEKSISIYNSLNEKSKLGDVYSHTGVYYAKLKEPQKAKECLERSLGSNLETDDKLSSAEVYINLSNFDDAIEISKGVLDNNDVDYRSRCLAHIFTSISLFSLGGGAESYTNIKELIRYHSINKSTAGKLNWDFSDIVAALKNLNPSERILIEDLISLIQNKTTYPAIRIDRVNIEREKAGDCAKVFHPFVGRKTITKDDDSLKKIMKDLSTGDIEINIDESTVMGIERDTALMTLGFLYKKEFIDFKETAPNNLKVGLTDMGQRIPKFTK